MQIFSNSVFPIGQQPGSLPDQGDVFEPNREAKTRLTDFALLDKIAASNLHQKMNDLPPSTHGNAPSNLEPHRGTLILVLGILSLTTCTIFTGIPAWIMGKGDSAKIKEGIMDPEGEGTTKAGMICGMICCIFTAVSLAIVLLIVIVGGGLAALSG